MAQRRVRAFHEDDGGFSSVGMVLALLLSVSLVIGSAQVYRTRSEAADIQNVADACALAAQNQVASFYIVAQVCDCAVFSLSLAGTATLGLGLVAACIPPAQGLSEGLVKAGRAILEARSRFARSAEAGLERLQALLPAIAAVDAAALAAANATSGSSYYAIAVLCPLQGGMVSVPEPAGEQDTIDEVADGRGQIAQAAQEAQESAQAADAHRQAAFMADCGSAPGYCMYERAETLAGLAGADNPFYSSADTWSFSVALVRARTYYWQRYLSEAPASDAVDEQARSAIRERFYALAVDLLAQGYVYEDADSFDAYFPLLPRNTDEMRTTRLYTEGAYPVSEDEAGLRMTHAYLGCPGMDGAAFVGMGSVELMESEGMEKCPVCGFAASSVGKVAAASTSIDNGFEYHYQVLAREAALYQQERAQASEKEQGAKGPFQRLLDALSSLLGESAQCRVSVDPPGRVGAIAVVLEPGGYTAADVVPNNIVAPAAPLGARVAVSAATLADDDAQEAETVVSSLLDGVLSDVAGLWAVDAALGVWSHLLVAYTNGTSSLVDNLRGALDSLPLVGRLGLGSWAAEALTGAVEAAGLAPPDLVSRKPVLVNTYHVASADGGSFGQGIVSAKDAAMGAYGPLAHDPLSAVVGVAAGRVLAAYDSWDATFVIAQIELLGEGGPSIPVEVTLPPDVKDAGAGLIEQAASALLGAVGQIVEVKVWE